MSQAYYDEASRHTRSLLERLADKASKSVSGSTDVLSRAADKTSDVLDRARSVAAPRVTPVIDHVRKRRVPYALAALAIGIGIGVLLHRPTRDAAGKLAGKAWTGARTSFGDELTRELKSLFGR